MAYLDENGLSALVAKIKALIPTVPAWAMSSQKPTYTCGEVGAAPAVHNHSVLHGTDTRNEASPPSGYFGVARLRPEFKYQTAIGVNGALGSTYCALLTISPWTDASGGRPMQLAFDNSNGIACRCASTDSDWGTWKKLALYAYDSATKTLTID